MNEPIHHIASYQEREIEYRRRSHQDAAKLAASGCSVPVSDCCGAIIINGWCATCDRITKPKQKPQGTLTPVQTKEQQNARQG